MFSLKQILQLRKSFREVNRRKKKNPLTPGSTANLRSIREQNVGNEELLRQAVSNLSANGIKVLLAGDGPEAREILRKEVAGSGVIVKSKSNVCRELKVTDFLGGLGKTVVETDIGDRLLQITGGKPSHPTGPASHLSLKEISSALKEHFGAEAGGTPEEIVAFLKADIDSYIEKADTAIVGANAVAAEEGSIVIIHNEGNISEIIQRTGRLIVITGIDKIYKNLGEAIEMVKSVTFGATGAKVPSFINIISGPSKTADIEKKLIRGVHSPREITLILLNGKRSGIASGAFREILYCIGCGSCLMACPTFNVLGDRFASGEGLGGRGLILSYLGGGNESITDAACLCLSCFHCKRDCPADINIPAMIWRMRALENRSNLAALVRSRFIYAANLIRLKIYELREFFAA